MHRAVRRDCRPNNSRRVDLPDCFPVIDVDLKKSAKGARTHPKCAAIPRQRLRRYRRRSKSFSLFDRWKFHVSLNNIGRPSAVFYFVLSTSYFLISTFGLPCPILRTAVSSSIPAAPLTSLP